MAGVIPLTALKKGDWAAVAQLPGDNRQMRKLLVFGILPGMRLTVLQVWPCYVLRVDRTVLALDRELAGKILIQQ